MMPTLQQMAENARLAHDRSIRVPRASRATMVDVVVRFRMEHGSSRSDLLMRRQYSEMPLKDLRSFYEGVWRVLNGAA